MAVHIRLKQFDGPLDLLLHLIGKAKIDLGVDVLPVFPKDNTDRNRTSPFAFTGNKFEFRMLGSSLNIAGPNIVLNTIVAEALRQIADILEAADDFDAEVHNIIRRTYKNHKRIVFNGDGYSEAWQKEAEKRGLPNHRTLPDAVPHFRDAKNLKLFTDHRIFTEQEIVSRTEIMLENYVKTLRVEARTMCDMARRDILPAVSKQLRLLGDTPASVYESETQRTLMTRADALFRAVEGLSGAVEAAPHADLEETADYYRDVILPKMDAVRREADALETRTSREFWPFPTYLDLLFGV